VFFVPPPTRDRLDLGLTVAHAAVASGVKFLLMMSVLTAEVTTTTLGSHFAPLEAYTRRLRIPWCIIRVPLFMDTLAPQLQNLRGQSQGLISGVPKPNQPFVMATIKDIGAAAAAILALPDNHVSKIYRLGAPPCSFDELSTAVGRMINGHVTYRQVTPFEAGRNLGFHGPTAWEWEALAEVYALVDTGSPITNELSVEDTVNLDTLLGRPATTVWEWAKQVLGRTGQMMAGPPHSSGYRAPASASALNSRIEDSRVAQEEKSADTRRMFASLKEQMLEMQHRLEQVPV